MITSPGNWRPLNGLVGVIGMEFYATRACPRLRNGTRDLVELVWIVRIAANFRGNEAVIPDSHQGGHYSRPVNIAFAQVDVAPWLAAGAKLVILDVQALDARPQR